MKQKIVTVIDEFVDYQGLSHKFTVAAVSEECDGIVDLLDNEGNFDRETYITKAVKLGVSVCNPSDVYEEEKGKKIAICKALNTADYALYSTFPGMINTAIVDALIKQEVSFIKSNPERVIPGYNEAKAKFEKRLVKQRAIDSLTEEERTVYNALKEHKYPKVEALLNA